MHCRVASLELLEFKNRLGYNHTSLTLNKEQAVIIRIWQYSELNNKYKITHNC